MIRLSHPTKKIQTRIRIPGSKSESNRALILRALSGSQMEIKNLSPARDTQNLKKILEEDLKTADVIDAGTSMRFLTAFYCATDRNKIITGNERMKNRPLHPLVNALLDIGFDIHYLEKEGFPPVETHPVNISELHNEVWMEGNISSQFISALLLIAPFLPEGLKIKFTTALTSKPYIEMTVGMLKKMGAAVSWGTNSIEVTPLRSSLADVKFNIGGDWSAASYWYSIAFLADEAEIFLEGLRDDWSQGDRIMAEWMMRFGVVTEFNAEGALVKKTAVNYPRMMKLNFKDNPDLAQTFAAMFGAKNIITSFSGIDSLKIKETDRVLALQTELHKMNLGFEYAPLYQFYQLRGNFQLPAAPVQTYGDHRMAMSFAPLALLGEMQIEKPEVVEKSYPAFWSDLEKAGFVIQ